MMQDITERKQAELALKESEYRYRMLFEAASDSIFLMKGNLFFDCNSKTLEMFGCTREQIIGVSPDQFSPPLQPDGRDSRDEGPGKDQRRLCRPAAVLRMDPPQGRPAPLSSPRSA